MKDKDVASPISTGGGGEQFEQHVAAFALALLLVRAVPPILTDTSVVEVHLQTGHRGWCTDDLLLICERSDGTRRRLAMQVKRRFTVSARDCNCRKTIHGMWNDFRVDDRSEESADQLAIVTLHGTSVLLGDFGSLLHCARASINAEDFGYRLSLNGFLSKTAKSQYRDIRQILTEENGTPPDDKVYWRFLRAVSVLSYDFNTSTSQTKADALSLLSCCMADGSASNAAARSTWAKLLECAGEGRPMAKNYARKDLPSELLERHAPVSGGDRNGLKMLIGHGQTVRDGIRSIIGDGYAIERSFYVQSLAAKLADHQVVIVSGGAGSGKSALACKLLAQLQEGYPVLSFQAVEFATAHVDEVLANAQTVLNLQQLLALLVAHDRKVVLIDGVERLLEYSVRDAFSQLLQLPRKDPSIRIVLTVRDDSLETVRNALIPAELKPEIFEVPSVFEAELNGVRNGVPALALPLGNARLRAFLRTPYLLDLASRLRWEDAPFPASLREFRKKIWQEVVRADGFTARGMPDRREQVFLDIASRRAMEIRPFVKPGVDDMEALDALRRDSLVDTPGNSSAVYSVTHDILEDWGVLRWIEDRFVENEGSLPELAKAIGGYPAIRRGFRQWLAERFEMGHGEARALVLDAIGQDKLPSYFRDDCLVGALLSESAGEFIEGCRQRIAGGDIGLLVHMTYMLRVACKESPKWLDDMPGLPSQIQVLVPTGAGWVPTLRLVLDLIDALLPKHVQIVFDLVEDWVKRIDERNPEPDGVEQAGAIVARLLPEFDSYGSGDARDRALKVLVKIPGAVPQFRNIIERAKTCSPSDRMASGLMKLVLTNPEGAFVCRDFPDEVIALVDARLRLTDADRDRKGVRLGVGLEEIIYGFGVRDDLRVGFYFPASALQGPFSALLRYHPGKGLQFLLSLVNHAGEWYATRQGAGRIPESDSRISLKIPEHGTVEQWSDPWLYCLYRGIQVGSASIVSALMALESWLLRIGKTDGIDLESYLLYVLGNSNSVLTTGVVASICAAYPERAGRAGLALLSSRDIVQLDRQRLGLEISVGVTASSGHDPLHRMFEQERVAANACPHRREDLESLAVRMQLGEHRDDVWAIIDRHRADLSAESGEDTRVWRLALHRMDIRHFEHRDAPEGTGQEGSEHADNRIYFGPGKVEPDIQEMVDETTRSSGAVNRYLGLENFARKMWDENVAVGEVDWKTSLLAEAQAVERELDEPEEFCRNGPGFVASICIRDHLSDLDERDFEWCARRVEFEVRRKSETADKFERCGRGMEADRVCASVVPILATQPRKIHGFDAMTLLSLSLTHPIDHVSEYAFNGLGAVVGEEHRALVLQCVAAAAYRSRLATASRERARRGLATNSFESIVPAVRMAIEQAGLDVERELGSLEFGNPLAGAAIRAALTVLGRHPDWEESREFYSRIARWLVDVWRSDVRNLDDMMRNFKLKSDTVRPLASFVLRLPWEEASRISAPIVDAIGDRRKDVEQFVSALIMSADVNTSDCFWELWQRLADKIAHSQWGIGLTDECSHGSGLVHAIFLGISWKKDVRHWHRLDGHAGRLDELARTLPATVPVLLAYSNFLIGIGQQSLPRSFEVVAYVLEKGDAVRIASHSAVAFSLETLLCPFVYSQPHRLKTDPSLRKAILVILDALVAGGSSSAYRMRDDFVTPSSKG